MKAVLNILELITIIAWFGCILISMGINNASPAVFHENVKVIAAILCMVAGLWVIIAALTAYITTKQKRK